MFVSVVIPARNEEDYIRKCLDSLYKQTRLPEEIIVVDNNSKDKTAEMVKRFYPKIKLIKEMRIGAAHARDTGFNAARGEIICRTDADVRPGKNWVKKILTFFKKTTNAVAVSGPVVFYEKPLNILGPGPSVFVAAISRVALGQEILYGPNMAIKKSAWKKIKPCSNNPNLHEDYDLAQHLSEFGKVCFDKNNVVFASGRRVYKTPKRFFIDYTRMFINHLSHNRHFISKLI